MRKRVEELFGEAKEFMGLRHMKFRGAVFVREQVLLTAMTQNIKRIVKLLSTKGPQHAPSELGVMPCPVSEAAYHLARWIRYLMQAKSSFGFQST
jgi:hypothetical protein